MRFRALDRLVSSFELKVLMRPFPSGSLPVDAKYARDFYIVRNTFFSNIGLLFCYFQKREIKNTVFIPHSVKRKKKKTCFKIFSGLKALNFSPNTMAPIVQAPIVTKATPRKVGSIF